MNQAVKKKIIHVTNYRPTDGRSIDHRFLLTAEMLVNKGWELHFIFCAEPAASFKEKLLKLGVSYDVVKIQGHFGGWLGYLKVFLRFKPDVTLTNFLGVNDLRLAIIKLLRVTGYVIAVDDTSVDVGKGFGFRKKVIWLKEKVLHLRSFDKLLTVSEFKRKHNLSYRYINEKVVEVYHNSVDIEEFPYFKRLSREELHIVYAGRLVPQKGVETLLTACNILRNMSRKKFRVTIAGNGNQEKALKQKVEDLGLDNVSFVGFVDRVAALYADADIVVVPSLGGEAFGLSAAEALAVGAGVIVSSSGALPEVVGDAGLVFEKGDAEALARHMETLITQPELREELGRKGHERVKEMFNIDKKVLELVGIIEDAAAGNK